MQIPARESGPSSAASSDRFASEARVDPPRSKAIAAPRTDAPRAAPSPVAPAGVDSFRPAVFPLDGAPARLRARWAAPAAQLCGLVVLAYLCLFNLSVVRGSSMAPRIHDGDRILIDHFSYLFSDVRRGDIVVLKYPLDPSVDYIKRVIGLPGDDVVIDVDGVWVNGERLAEPYVDQQDPSSHVNLRVRPAHFFVLGDNRPRSCDSREFGLVPQDYIRGKVEMRVWPPSRVGAIDG